MYLIVGLGNPGPKYEETRHNVGFLFLDWLAQEAGGSFAPSSFDSLTTKVRWEGQDLLLVKPQTFMNLSGGPVQEIVAFYKLVPEQVIVVFDDLDMSPLTVKMRFGGGHGGHNGIRDILARLGSDKFHRIKVGIGKPEHKSATSGWVLGKFPPEQMEQLKTEVFNAVKQRIKDAFRAYAKMSGG